MSPKSGRALKEDNTVVNTAEMLEAIYNALVVNKDAGITLSGSNVEQTPGAAIPTKAAMVGGSDGTNLIPLKVGADGSLYVSGITVDTLTATEVDIKGSILVEQKTQADAVANVITFSANISAIEIYHEELTWQDFIVNGLPIKIPAGGYRTPIAGVSATTVTIPDGINCLVGRLV